METGAPGEPRRALYVGRFQVFHLGHVDVLRLIAATPDVDEVVIAVGSSQYDHRHKSPEAPWAVNPFTFEERREMIEGCLEGTLPKPFSVHALPDAHDWERWHRSIRETLPPCAILYSIDPKEHAFFAERGWETRPFARERPYHAGLLRKRLAAGEGCVDELPLGTLVLLERIGAAARLRELYARDEREGNRRVEPSRTD
jgi:nicotinamide-nucleotide adenylyltransferase